MLSFVQAHRSRPDASPKNRFSGKFYPSLIIDSDTFHFDQVTHLDGVVNAFDPAFSEFGDMNQAVTAWEDFDKSTENP